MKDLPLTLLHLAVVAAKLCGPGGVRAVIVENLLLKQQLIVLRRARQRAPNLTLTAQLLCGFGSLFLSPGRIRKVAIALRPSTLLAFHQALVRRKYRRLFSSMPSPKKPGPKGPDEALIQAIVELKSRNPRFGCPRIARIISLTFGIDIDKNVVYLCMANSKFLSISFDFAKAVSIGPARPARPGSPPPGRPLPGYCPARRSSRGACRCARISMLPATFPNSASAIGWSRRAHCSYARVG
jgi:hypothetical protein